MKITPAASDVIDRVSRDIGLETDGTAVREAMADAMLAARANVSPLDSSAMTEIARAAAREPLAQRPTGNGQDARRKSWGSDPNGAPA